MSTPFRFAAGALRKLRKHRGLKQKQVAECLRSHANQTTESLTNMYSRIENKETTTLKRATAIAERLGVDVEALRDTRAAGETGPALWVECSDIDNPPVLLPGIEALANRLWPAVERATNLRFNPRSPTSVDVRVKQSECRLIYFQPKSKCDETWYWSIRPAKRTTRGIEWLEFTRGDLDAIETHLHDIAMRSADQLKVRGSTQSEAGEWAYRLRTFPAGANSIEEIRTKDSYFASPGRLAAAICARFKSLGSQGAFVDANDIDVTVSPLLGDSFQTIVRVWRRGAQSPWTRSPWHVRAVRRLGTIVESSLMRSIPGICFYELDVLAHELIPRDRTIEAA